MDIGDRQFQVFLEWASSGWIIPVLALYCLLLASTILIRPMRWVLLTLFLYACTFGLVQTTRWFDNTLAPPLEQIRYFGRIICIGLLAAMLVPTVTSGKGWRSRLVLWSTVALVAFELMLSSRLLLAGLIGRGIVGPIVYGMMFLVLGVGVSSWVQTPAQVYTVIRCMAAAGVLLVLGTCYQLLANHHAIVLNGRLYATTNNPNTLGYISGLAIPAMCALVMRGDERKASRVLMGVAAGILIVFVIWSGSRGGVLMCTVSLGLLFRRHLRHLWLAVLLAGAAAAIGFSIWTDISVERLISVQDTRTEAWLNMLHQFRVSPVFGVGTQEGMLVVQENSLLAIAATSGLFGLIPFVVAIVAIVMTIRRLRRARPALGELDLALAGDVIGASIIALLVQSVFEATFTGMLVMSVAGLYVYLAAASYLLEVATHPLATAAAFAPAGVDPQLQDARIGAGGWGEPAGGFSASEAMYEETGRNDPAYTYEHI